MTDTFQTWLRKCDAVVSGKVGLGLHDLPDANWRDYFEDGLSPKDAADCAYDDQWCDEMPSDLGTHTIIQRWILHFLSPKKMEVRNDNTHPYWQ